MPAAATVQTNAILALRIRAIRSGDAAAIAAIDAAHTGLLKRRYWRDVVTRHAGRGRAGGARVGLVAVEGAKGRVVGYVMGRVRSFEFGSEPCAWIVALGVHPRMLRGGVASRLFAEACRRFAQHGITLVRTMVRRDDVGVLTFFRSQGFVAGPYVELELSIPETTP
ncbi:MAG TPA: GNAT family N-acetyltransferase [Candidatus Polarisedimenticolia bacterium]|nr:GNAT family N-acetyltransferase [Candidatus Polarisedimenticolia bacterium]